ncbi:MAG: hypothetical protein U0103_14515 [Candidatus Obscuribacterales bacterium]
MNQSILDVIPDGQRVLDAVRGLSEVRPFVTLGEVLVGRSEVASSHFDVCISSLCRQNDVADALLMFVPPGSKQVTMSAEAENSKRASEQLANSLSRQMSWERWVRQIICKLHATLDRDTILQTVVDGFGRALGASRCLIVRTDGPARLWSRTSMPSLIFRLWDWEEQDNFPPSWFLISGAKWHLYRMSPRWNVHA